MPEATGDMSTSPTSAQAGTYTRLNINLNAEAAAALKEYIERRHITYTEAIRRAIALLKFIDDEMLAGHELQIFDGETVRKIVLVS